MRKTDWLQLFAQPEEPARAGENAGDTGLLMTEWQLLRK